ncbi:MAG: hypothetical protein OEW65_02890 [Thermoleophilia bacterium]|nr:hypothetical protein [Thermoleophilia bacterium]
MTLGGSTQDAGPPLGTSDVLTGRGGWPRWRLSSAIAALAVVAVVAAAAGIVIGRATEHVAAPLSWRPLPQAPMAGRLSGGEVWTGTEMIVWGGAAPGAGVSSSGGAADAPATRTWRSIAPAPAGVEGGAAVAWTGDEMVVWASNSPDGPAGAAAYDPDADSWRTLPAGPLGWREGYASVWTGKELVVVGGNLGDTLAKPLAAALDPAAGTWRLLPALNRLGALFPGASLTWSGSEAFLLGALCTERTSCSPVFLAYDPATDALRRIDLAAAPIVPEQQLSLVGWSGTDVVFTIVGVSSNVNSGKIAVVRYDPAADTWRKGAFAPFPGTQGVNQQTAWLGDRLVVPDGSSGLQIYTLATDSWETITPGPSPLNWGAGSAVVWTGSQLIAWSGMVYARDNPTPNEGASLELGG